MSTCPCGTGKPYSECCEPYISGKKSAPTGEALMRSRYTAYVKHDIDYIEDTQNPDRRRDFDREETSKWSKESEWLGLEILRTEKGQEADDHGIVEFIARYKRNGTETAHHEESSFVRKNGMWYFHDGRTPSITVVRQSPKVGRNDPCPCGSGKKFKKCCG